MSDFVAVIPAAGQGTRLGLPYPKELHSIEPGVLYIDYCLMHLAAAGIKLAYIVVSPEKLSAMATALRYERHGIELVYVDTQPTDSKSLAGSVLRGCKRANYQGEWDKFIVMLPDVKMSDPEIAKSLMSVPAPTLGLFSVEDPSCYDAVYGEGSAVERVVVKKPVDDETKFRGTWGAITLDYETVKRLRKIIRTSQKAEQGDHHLLGEVIDADIKAGGQWFYLEVPGSYVDLGEWERVHNHVTEIAKEKQQ